VVDTRDRRESRREADGTNAAQAPIEGGEQVNERRRGRGLKVLVVDDDPFVLRVTSRRLEHVGHQVVTRSSPLGTSKAIADEAPDVVLLDVHMPALSGQSLAAILRERGSSVAIIFHSSLPVESMEQMTREVGALGCIRKTASDDDFVRCFTTLVEAAPRVGLGGFGRSR
jgi:CheY-like chemotaxis protein